MSQQDLTLQMLRDAGERGVHTFELRQAFIGNPSERIARLEKLGHRIRVGSKERLHGRAMGVRYFLEFDVERAAGNAPVAAPAPCLDAAADEPPPGGSLSTGLFDADEFAERGDWRDVA